MGKKSSKHHTFSIITEKILHLHLPNYPSYCDYSSFDSTFVIILNI